MTGGQQRQRHTTLPTKGGRSRGGRAQPTVRQRGESDEPRVGRMVAGHGRHGKFQGKREYEADERDGGVNASGKSAAGTSAVSEAVAHCVFLILASSFLEYLFAELLN